MTVFTATPMRTLFRYLLLAALLVGAWVFVAPYLRSALYAMRLASMPVPENVAMPVSGVRPQGLRDTWHGPRSGGRKHEGIDIFARRGTEVRSATEGIVLRVGNNSLGGRVVWVFGPGAQRHYYAHLDRFAEVSAGMRVGAGTVLGYVGTTGNAAGTPPHLHYGIYQAGGAINPYPVLRTGGPRVQARDAAR
jgi:murein DD-endopeptidase MepM/ murein hydrolase activator NlpD